MFGTNHFDNKDICIGVVTLWNEKHIIVFYYHVYKEREFHSTTGQDTLSEKFNEELSTPVMIELKSC